MGGWSRTDVERLTDDELKNEAVAMDLDGEWRTDSARITRILSASGLAAKDRDWLRSAVWACVRTGRFWPAKEEGQP